MVDPCIVAVLNRVDQLGQDVLDGLSITRDAALHDILIQVPEIAVFENDEGILRRLKGVETTDDVISARRFRFEVGEVAVEMQFLLVDREVIIAGRFVGLGQTLDRNVPPRLEITRKENDAVRSLVEGVENSVAIIQDKSLVEFRREVGRDGRRIGRHRSKEETGKARLKVQINRITKNTKTPQTSYPKNNRYVFRNLTGIPPGKDVEYK